MTKKFKALSITSAVLMGASLLGGGIGIGIAINVGNNQSSLDEQKRSEIIRQRSQINSMMFATFSSRNENSENYKDFIWKKEYGDFLRTIYYSPEENININKPWYNNYGPFYQTDRSYYTGKLLVSQKNNFLINSYQITNPSETVIGIWMIVDIWEITDRNLDGSWNEKHVYPVWAQIDIDKNF